jgi:demethoxyubiquinone hydroxylase (CLK1/Coq7/Cat5 family)
MDILYGGDSQHHNQLSTRRQQRKVSPVFFYKCWLKLAFILIRVHSCFIEFEINIIIIMLSGS